MAASRVAPDSAAPTPLRLIPAANTNQNRPDVASLYFTVGTRLFGKVFSPQRGLRKPMPKKQAAQGEALSGLVGEVLRGRRIC